MLSPLEAIDQINLVYQAQKKQWAQQLDCNVAQINILLVLPQDEDAIAHAELIKAMRLDASTLSRQLGSMVNAQLIEKLPNDKPRLRIYQLSDKGISLKNQLIQLQDAFEADIWANWSQEEQQLLRILLNRYSQSANRLENK